MTKTKNKYDVTTVAKCLTDNATDDKGAVAFNTFMTEDVEYSNDYMIPFHAICETKVKLTQDQVEVEDNTCVTGDEPTPGEPRIDGANNTSVPQGMGFDLTAGVKAYDADGNEIPFTVTPSEFDKCDIGHQSFTYSAEGVTKERTIEVTGISDPTISGLTPLELEVDEEFDPLDGVSAVDGNGNTVEVTVEQPTQNITLIDLSNYTAPNNTPIAKVNEWDRSKGQNLVVEATGVVVNGTVQSGANFAYFDGSASNPSVAVSLEPLEGVVEEGAGVWFSADETDSTKIISNIGSEGSGDYRPTTVFFERLVVKQEVE